jgi:hypothetical protein
MRLLLHLLQLVACLSVSGGTCAADDHACHEAAGGAVAVDQPGLRFGVGDVVLANMGRGVWKIGKVTRLNVRDANWAADQVAPYGLELEGGGGVYVPVDEDSVVRRASPEAITRMREADELEARMGREAHEYKEAQLAAANALTQEARPDLHAVLTYHAESCHVRPGLYAAGGNMDWQNQPDKFRRVLGATSLDLPRSGADVQVQ